MGIFTRQEEQSLIRAAQWGSQLAMRQLYERYASRMMAVCRRYLPCSDAEDAMIEAFQRAFLAISQYRFEGSFEGWLRRIVVNTCLQHLRSRHWETTQIENSTAEMNLVLLPEQVVLQDLDAAYLLGLLDRLPAGYRAVFNLYAIEGFSHKEIAKLLGISEGTSKSQLSKARKMLQTWIAEEQGVSKIHTR